MKTTFEIENLKCGGCVKTATEGAAVLDGISNVIVSLENNSITFESSDEGSINKVEEKLIILPLIILSFNLSNKKIVN